MIFTHLPSNHCFVCLCDCPLDVFAMNVSARVTSSSLCVIMVNALKTQSVEPVMVMILSGQEPSEMLTRALLCGQHSKVKL